MGLLFEDWERKHIIDFYKKPSWWGKSLIVTRYEWLKALKDLDKGIEKTILFKIIERFFN